MNTSESAGIQKPWQSKNWVQLLAIAVGVLPGYIFTIVFHLRSDESLTMRSVLWYSMGIGGVMTVVMLLLLRFLCGESIRDLNRKPGKWWKDILVGIGLSVLSIAALILLSNPINALFAREPDSGLGKVFNEMTQNPWLFAMFIGPSLIIGAAIFEELSRVFLLSRWWKMSPNKIWQWAGILISVALFGFAHIYQGPAGVVMTGLYGLIMAMYYYFLGRVAALMIAHYLHDALQIALIFIIANAA